MRMEPDDRKLVMSADSTESESADSGRLGPDTCPVGAARVHPVCRSPRDQRSHPSIHHRSGLRGPSELESARELFC